MVEENTSTREYAVSEGELCSSRYFDYLFF